MIRTSVKQARALFSAGLVIAAATLAAVPVNAQSSKAADKTSAAKSGSAKGGTAKAGAAKAGASKSMPGGGQANLLAAFGDWGAYASQGKVKVCYALSQPKAREPKALKRDPGYFFVSIRPAENVRNEISMVLGFPAKDGSNSQAVIDGNAFALITKGEHGWLKNPAEEGQVVAALAKGQSLVLKLISKRGNKLSDEYSLRGFTQALERARKECS